jgi:regulator of protease activity HflC (stomatin/prohibitin superfamily)
MKIKITTILGAVALLGLALVIFTGSGINDAGHRTVIQYPNGSMKVKFTPGWYLTGWGSTTVYNDVITFDFDKTTSSEGVSLDQNGSAVRYQDGGLGTIYGKARFSLPDDRETMLELHNAFRNNRGVSQKLIKTVTEESLNLTAGLMTSEEAYAEKRTTFTEWSREQVESGKFKTVLDEIVVTNESGKTETRKVPVIQYGENGLPIHSSSDFKQYGIRVDGFQITDWDFEQKTLQQISAKREATMAIITAKANAERAKQEALTAEEQGKANVMTAKYEMEVEKEKAIVEAERAKEVAIIAAEKLVETARQGKLEAEQKKLAAYEYQEEQIARAEGDAEYKRKVMEADGALQQKLATYENVNARYAQAIAAQKWVPEIEMGGGTGGDSNAAEQLINLLMTKTAKDLSLDLTTK